MATGTDEGTHKVTMEDINEVTEQLGASELKLLYDNLGIPPHKVEIAEADMASMGIHDTTVKARAVLRKWLKKKGRDATREALFGERDKILKRRTTAGTSEPGTGEFDLKQCQDQLRKLYLGPQMKVQLTPWLDDEAREMEAIFVNLEMEKVKDSAHPHVKQKELERNEDLVTLQTDEGLWVNRTLIRGEAGSGKSTLLNNIAYKWAKLQGADSSQSSDSRSLSEFDLVFLISMNEIDEEHKNDTLEDIIFDQILEKRSNVSPKGLKSYLETESNSERCLFLVDGIDESSVGILNSTKSEMSKLIYYNKIYRNSCVIASTRPETLKNKGHSTKLHVYTKVNLTGFSSKNIEVYIKKHFGTDNISHYADLLNQLSENIDIWEMATIPLLLMLFCILWDDPDQANRSLPNTKTKLYNETITSLWKRYHHTKPGLAEEDESLDLKSFLENLGKVTLEGRLDLSKERFVFNNDDFDKTTLSLALGVGIMSRRKIKSKLHMTSSVKLLHKSFQDYCSAVYLANLQCKDNETFEKCTTKIICALKIERSIIEVLFSCAGYRPETVKLITNLYVGNKKKSNKIINIKIIFELAFQAQLTYEECNELVSILTSAGCQLGYLYVWIGYNVLVQKHIQYQCNLIKTVTSSNGLLFSTISNIELVNAIEFTMWYPLFVSMLRYTKQIQDIKLKFEFLDAPDQIDLFEMFDALVHLTNLKSLILAAGLIFPFKVHVSNIHKIGHIKLVRLHLMQITFNVTSMIAYLNQNTSLKCLGIINYQDRCIYNTFSMIKAISKLKLSNLCLGGIAIGRAVQLLEAIIPQLENLMLYHPFLDVWDVYKLVSYLKEAKALEGLHLGIEFTFGTAISSLADKLKYMVNLRELGLANCGLGNNDSYILANGIKEMRTLCKLNLTNNQSIGLEGKQVIKDLRLLPQFQELEITLDPLPWEEGGISSRLDECTFEDRINVFGRFVTEEKTKYEIRKSLDSMRALPDCCCCMSQIYNGVTCKMSSMKSSSTVKDEKEAGSTTASSELTESKVKGGKNKYNFDLCDADTSADITLSSMKELETSSMSASTSSLAHKLVSPSDQSKSLGQQPIVRCYNSMCSKPETELPGCLKRCSRCKTAVYCSRDCQRKHWKIHRSSCGKDL